MSKKLSNKPHFPSLRFAQLKRLFYGRYGDELPNNSKGRDYALIMVHHLAAVNHPDKAISKWLRVFAPWMKRSEVEAMTRVKPKRYRTVRLGELLGLTYEERMLYGITTIRAIDCQDKREQTRRREARKQEARTLKRRAQGVKSRAEYLASVRRKSAQAASPERSGPTNIPLKGNIEDFPSLRDSNPKPEELNKLNLVSKMTKEGLIFMESDKPQEIRKKGNDNRTNWWRLKKEKVKPEEAYYGKCIDARDQAWVIGQGLGGLPKLST
jgi:hypothetical protein